MDVFDLVATLSLDTSEAESGLSKFSSGIGGAVGGIAKAAAGAMAAATTAVVGFTASAVQAGSSFDSSMSQVAATMGTTVDQIGELRDFAQQMGSTTSFSASEAADALNYMALAGYDAEKSMEMLPNVLNLAAAGGMDLAAASDMVTDASSALGLTTEETTAMVDKMATASSKSNTSVEQLGNAMLAVGGTAKSMAGGTTEIATALGILADNGTKGAEGGTALRNVLLGIQGDKFEDTFGALGVSAYDAEGNLRELKDVFADMNVAMEGMTDEEKTDIISKTFNKADLKNVNALLATSTERWDELSAAIDNSEGSAAKMAETQLDNLEGDVTKFKSAWEGLQIAISDGVTPSLREFVQFGTEGISKITEGFKTGGIEGAFSAIGDILKEAIKKITEALPEITGVATQLISSLVSGIVENLPALSSAALEIIKQLGSVIIENLPTLAQAAIEIIMQLSSFLTENIPMLIETGLQIIQGIGDFLIQNLPLLIDAGIQLTLAIVEGLANALPNLVDQMLEITESIIDIIIDNLDKFIEAAVRIVLALIEGIVQATPRIIAKMPELIGKLVKALISALPQLISAGIQIIDAVLSGIGQVIDSIRSAGIEIVSKIAEGLLDNNVIVSLKNAISNIGTHISEGLKTVASSALEWGQDLMSSFIEGIGRKFRDLKDKLTSVAQLVKSILGFSEPETGPLSNFHTYAPDMIDLFIEGMEDNKSKLLAAVSDTFDFGNTIKESEINVGATNIKSSEKGDRNVTVILELDKTQLGRAVFNLNKEESRRVGAEMIYV